MKKHSNIRTVICAAVVFYCCFLPGCSFSFCGLQPGRETELIFSCKEELQTEDADKAEEGIPAVHADEAEMNLPKVSESDEAENDKTKKDVSGRPDDGRIDLNSAGLEELMSLNGIGQSRAEAIIEYRRQNGPFSKIEDIMQVSGIKEGVFSKIQDQIAVH